jgi:hypothetical protein
MFQALCCALIFFPSALFFMSPGLVNHSINIFLIYIINLIYVIFSGSLTSILPPGSWPHCRSPGDTFLISSLDCVLSNLVAIAVFVDL